MSKEAKKRLERYLNPGDIVRTKKGDFNIPAPGFYMIPTDFIAVIQNQKTAPSLEPEPSVRARHGS